MSRIWLFGFLLSFAVSASLQAQYTFDGSTDNDYLTAANWTGNGGSVPDNEVPGTTTAEQVVINGGSTVNLSGATPGGIRAIRLEGGSGTATLNVLPGANAAFNTSANWDSSIGRDGASGIVNQSGGTMDYNFLELGRDSGVTGTYNLSGGSFIIGRGGNAATGGSSLIMGTADSSTTGSGNGSLVITGGSFVTRAGAWIGTTGATGVGRFAVLGSGATEIGIGTQNSGTDGNWTLNNGSTLEVGIDPGGVTKILIDDHGNGNNFATFQSGSILEVDYYNGGFGGGTWTVLELENGDITDNGLAFHPDVDQSIWSFNIDNSGPNGLLTVTAAGDPAGIFGNWFTIEAEDYDNQSGTQLETTSDIGDGQNVAYISNNNWLLFENVTLGDNALLNFRVARNTGTEDGHIEVRLGSPTGTLIAQIDVPETGGWQNWETISIPVAPVTTQEDIYLVFVETNTTTNGTLFNLNWWSKTAMVEAENFTDAVGERFEDTQDIGGGQNLGWISDGEWIEYTIEPEVAGWHKFTFRVAGDNSDGYINIVLGGQIVGSVDIGDTGGWQNWINSSTYVELTSTGAQTLRLEFVVPSAAFNLNWLSYESSAEPLSIVVGNTPKQQMRYGIDYERLWFWSGSSSERDKYAEWSVADCDVDFVRVAMNSKYELTEGILQEDAYFDNDDNEGGSTSNDRIIPMMQDMKDANPDIKFFASPRPLNEAISGVAWQPYPQWVTGSTGNSSNFNFDEVKCSEYLIRYLILMKQYGFKISYMDLTNEWNFINGTDFRDISALFDDYVAAPDNAKPVVHPDYPTVLLTADDIPQLVGPSAYSYSQGRSWLSGLYTGLRRDALDIASCHNTDKTGTAQDFMDRLEDIYEGEVVPEAWNTELHGWKSTSNADEVLTYAYMLECINAGFSGISGWLAIGFSGQGHCYIVNKQRSVKYYMFEKLTNTSNRGYALDVNEPDEFKEYWDPDPDQADADSSVSALIRGNLMTVWVLNHAINDYPVTINTTGRTISDHPIKVTRWSQYDELSVSGEVNTLSKTTNSSLTTIIKDNSAYCFEILLEPETGDYVRIEAEDYDSSNPAPFSTEATDDLGDGLNLSNINDGNWTAYENIDLSDATNIRFRIAADSGRPDGEIEIRTGSPTGTLIGRTAIPTTDDWQNWLTIETPLEPTSGVHDLYLVYTVAGSNENGSGAMFNFNWFELVMPTPVTPSAPTGLTATANGTTQIDLAWSAVPEATSYRILRATSAGGTYTEIASGLNTTSTSDATASVGAPYYYVVRAVNGATESSDSNVATATLPLLAPSNLTASANGATQIDLAWNAVSGATSYTLLRSTSSGGTYTEIASDLASTSTTDVPPSIGVPYYYVVRAINAAAESADSNVANATLSLGTPMGLTATNASSSGIPQIDLTWNSVNGATSYTVKRSTVNGEGFTNIASGLGTPNYSDTTGLTLGTRYYYVVYASTSTANSSDSSQVSAVPSNPISPESITFGQMDIVLEGRRRTFNFSIMNSELGHMYQAQHRQYMHTGDWDDVGDPQPGTGGILNFEIPLPGSYTESFYRVDISEGTGDQ